MPLIYDFNTFLELLGAAAYILAPDALIPINERTQSYRITMRQWGAALLSLGSLTYLMRPYANTRIGRRIALALFFYHLAPFINLIRKLRDQNLKKVAFDYILGGAHTLLMIGFGFHAIKGEQLI